VRGLNSVLGLFITIGGALLLGGFTILLLGGDQRYGGPVFFGWDRVYYGGGLISIGSVVVYISLRKLKRTGVNVNNIMMCPRCGEAYNTDGMLDCKCPVCHVVLEDIKGFYKRHPEYK